MQLGQQYLVRCMIWPIPIMGLFTVLFSFVLTQGIFVYLAPSLYTYHVLGIILFFLWEIKLIGGMYYGPTRHDGIIWDNDHNYYICIISLILQNYTIHVIGIPWADSFRLWSSLSTSNYLVLYTLHSNDRNVNILISGFVLCSTVINWSFQPPAIIAY